jgi:hypothetical protein
MALRREDLLLQNLAVQKSMRSIQFDCALQYEVLSLLGS